MAHPARFWRRLEDGRVQCDLCPRECRLREGQRAFCFVRQAKGGGLVCTTYGQSTGFCVDPIEKKPLNHFYPGTPVLSFGTAGCNLGCRFCQNWSSSRSRQVERSSSRAVPEAVARAAKAHGCRSVAYTYNDPVIWAEYAMDTAAACRELGLKNVAVTAGYISESARGAFFENMDAANVDLKAFTEGFYKKLCLARLGPVLDTLEWLKKETGVWIEVTTLVIPGHNDGDAEIEGLCAWVAEHLGRDVPLHFSAFHPDFKMAQVPRTPASTLSRARQIAMQHGLLYVYTGNVRDREGDTTFCPGCGGAVIVRDWYEILAWELDDGACTKCGAPIAGRFDAGPGRWGSRRAPVDVSN
jgi:pyruvate formate lyase activating enzyme